MTSGRMALSVAITWNSPVQCSPADFLWRTDVEHRELDVRLAKGLIQFLGGRLRVERPGTSPADRGCGGHGGSSPFDAARSEAANLIFRRFTPTMWVLDHT
jgi:hypothetical protein